MAHGRNIVVEIGELIAKDMAEYKGTKRIVLAPPTFDSKAVSGDTLRSMINVCDVQHRFAQTTAYKNALATATKIDLLMLMGGAIAQARAFKALKDYEEIKKILIAFVFAVTPFAMSGEYQEDGAIKDSHFKLIKDEATRADYEKAILEFISVFNLEADLTAMIKIQDTALKSALAAQSAALMPVAAAPTVVTDTEEIRRDITASPVPVATAAPAASGGGGSDDALAPTAAAATSPAEENPATALHQRLLSTSYLYRLIEYIKETSVLTPKHREDLIEMQRLIAKMDCLDKAILKAPEIDSLTISKATCKLVLLEMTQANKDNLNGLIEVFSATEEITCIPRSVSIIDPVLKEKLEDLLKEFNPPGEAFLFHLPRDEGHTPAEAMPS